MQPDEKRKLVENLVNLTVGDTLSETDMSTRIGYEFATRMRQRIQKEQIDIRMKNFDEGQIRALLDFYGTEMGQSILASQSKIDHELASSMAAISSDVHNQVIEDMQSGVLSAQQVNPGVSKIGTQTEKQNGDQG